jgi:hypothetical protein
MIRRRSFSRAAAAAFVLAIVWLACIVFTSTSAQGAPEPGRLTLRSPDGAIELSVVAQGRLTYAVSVDRKMVLDRSGMGLAFRGGAVLGSDVECLNAEHWSVDSNWDNPWGKRSRVRDLRNELRVVLRQRSTDHRFEILFRAYNDGIAFRYFVPSQPGLESFVLEREQTEFAFAADCECFAGQQEKGFIGAQEWEFKPGHLSDRKPESIVGLPLLIKTPVTWVALTEADLRDWSGMWLGRVSAPATATSVVLQAKLAPRPDGQGLVKANTPHSSPWLAGADDWPPARPADRERSRPESQHALSIDEHVLDPAGKDGVGSLVVRRCSDGYLHHQRLHYARCRNGLALSTHRLAMVWAF